MLGEQETSGVDRYESGVRGYGPRRRLRIVLGPSSSPSSSPMKCRADRPNAPALPHVHIFDVGVRSTGADSLAASQGYYSTDGPGLCRELGGKWTIYTRETFVSIREQGNEEGSEKGLTSVLRTSSSLLPSSSLQPRRDAHRYRRRRRKHHHGRDAGVGRSKLKAESSSVPVPRSL